MVRSQPPFYPRVVFILKVFILNIRVREKKFSVMKAVTRSRGQLGFKVIYKMVTFNVFAYLGFAILPVWASSTADPGKIRPGSGSVYESDSSRFLAFSWEKTADLQESNAVPLVWFVLCNVLSAMHIYVSVRLFSSM